MNIRSIDHGLILLCTLFLVSCSSGGGSNRVPIAAFSVTPSVGLAPMDVALDASSSSDTDGSIAQYAWDFGDGQTGSGIAVTHTYSNADTYTITLTVTDNKGAQATQTTNVTSTIGIGGTITIVSGSAIDSDVNDPLAPYAGNNDFNTSQVLPNPVVLGGFVTSLATGVNPAKTNQDRFANTSDRYDVYRVTVAAGQVINLYISDYNSQNANAVDLDLRLYDVDDTSITADSSELTTSVESVTAPADGEYFLQIDAFSGTTKYILTIGQTINSSSVYNPSVDDEFVPGELLVKFDQRAVPTVAGVVTDTYLSMLGLTKVQSGPDQPVLMKLGDATQRSKTFNVLGIQQTRAGLAVQGFMNDKMRLKQDTIKVVQALRGRPDIRAADLNYIRHMHAAPDDGEYPKQWQYPMINLPQAWDITHGNSSVIVAVLDTGVFMAHADLSTNLLPNGATGGFDFISDPNIANDGNGIDSNPDDPGDNANLSLSTFHGTHVSGTVSADTNNNSGVAGTGWSTRVMPIRVLGLGGSGTSNDIIQGARYAAGLSNSSGTVPAQRADIINMSFGGYGRSSIEQDEVNAIRNAGIIIVASSGNDNSNVPIYPASYTGVISVSAIDRYKQRAPYSNYGSTVDITAPGGDMLTGVQNGILSTFVNTSANTRSTGYTYYQGTSMAAPHVAGVIALMKAIYPALSPTDFDSLLTSGSITEDLANNGIATRDDNFGYGMIDAAKAASKAVELAGGVVPPILVANPSSLNFGSSQTSLTLITSNAGGGSLSITDFSDDADWLSVAPTSVDANQLGTYTISANRSGLNDGIYSATITFIANPASTLVIPVSIQVGANTGITNDAGFHWILLVDAMTTNTVRTVNASSVAGTYTYIFSDVPPGSYYVLAGTDSDNDDFICDEGEACGGYPTRSLLSQIDITNTSFPDIDFGSGFNVNIGSTLLSLPQVSHTGFRRTIATPDPR